MNKILYTYLIIIFLLLFNSHFRLKAQNTKTQNKFWKSVSNEIPEYKRIFKKNEKYRFEIIYGQVNHRPGEIPQIKKYYFGNSDLYFYPASTVKLPVALRTMQLLNIIAHENNTDDKNLYADFYDSIICGGHRYQTKKIKYFETKEEMGIIKAANICGISPEKFILLNNLSADDVIAKNQRLIASENPEQINILQMMKEMLIYSNNEYYNILFELSNGQSCQAEAEIKIAHRFLPCIGENSDYTQSYMISNSNKTFNYKQIKNLIANRTKKIFDKGLMVGNAVLINDSLTIKKPKNFTSNNAIKLESLLNLLIEITYPGYLPESSFYDINNEQRKQLIRFLGSVPGEEKFVTDSTYLSLPTDYTNYLFTGQNHEPLPKTTRIINIVGQSYGFITDCMYFVDEKNKVDFFLAARIYANKDGILNDDCYDYRSIAFPLFEKLGKTIYSFELNRKKEFISNPGWLFEIFQE